jgi:L-aminopeptidase/D-esterase-like protein
VLFDLAVGDPAARPGPEAGHAAAEEAFGQPEGHPVAEGQVGAGCGATAAKAEGPHRQRPGGVGTASETEGDLVVGAIVVVNAYGEIVDDEGGVIVGPIPEEDAPPPPDWWPGPGTPPLPANTTIGLVATNARLNRERAHLLALAGHEGLLRAIRPAHTMWDGDTVFSLATGETDAPQATIERMAERVMAEAIRRAVRMGEGGGSQ